MFQTKGLTMSSDETVQSTYGCQLCLIELFSVSCLVILGTGSVFYLTAIICHFPLILQLRI
jgi:hypothetical protein